MRKIKLLTSIYDLQKQLITIEDAGRTCYQSYKGDVTLESARNFIKMLLRRGHESVIEHSCMAVKFSGVSRGKTHEMVRHRLCAFSQESTRYVDERDFDIVLPPGRSLEDVLHLSDNLNICTVQDIVAFYRQTYKLLRHNGWKKEDARQFLPIGLANEIIVSANFREWRHIFKMRLNKAAHWEIRQCMVDLLKQIQTKLSPIFDCFIQEGVCSKGVPHFKLGTV